MHILLLLKSVMMIIANYNKVVYLEYVFQTIFLELSSFKLVSKEHIHCDILWPKTHDQILKYRHSKYQMPGYKKWTAKQQQRSSGFCDQSVLGLKGLNITLFTFQERFLSQTYGLFLEEDRTSRPISAKRTTVSKKYKSFGKGKEHRKNFKTW